MVRDIEGERQRERKRERERERERMEERRIAAQRSEIGRAHV